MNEILTHAWICVSSGVSLVIIHASWLKIPQMIRLQRRRIFLLSSGFSGHLRTFLSLQYDALLAFIENRKAVATKKRNVDKTTGGNALMAP